MTTILFKLIIVPIISFFLNIGNNDAPCSAIFSDRIQTCSIAGEYDYFSFSTDCEVDSFSFQAFNRWNMLVFETEDPAFNWRGTYQNGDLPDGSYTYKSTVLFSKIPHPRNYAGQFRIHR